MVAICVSSFLYFYPRPPRGGRHRFSKVGADFLQFLSTPSARRATERLPRLLLQTQHFYPRPPRGGRPEGLEPIEQLAFISIHALREEGDRAGSAQDCADREFLSTPSARRATEQRCTVDRMAQYFYPRPPRGGRPASAPLRARMPLFLSTPSARRATDAKTAGVPVFIFLSTPSARRATGICTRRRRRMQYFYPRPPRGGRLRVLPNRSQFINISIHALREEGDPA